MRLAEAIAGRINIWRDRALKAEAGLAVANEALTIANVALEAAKRRAVLIDIVAANRTNKFTFARNGKVHVVETYSTMEDDVPGWRAALLGE